VQLSQVHRYSFAGGSVEACARFEAVTRLSVKDGDIMSAEVEDKSGTGGWRKFHCYRYRRPRAG